MSQKPRSAEMHPGPGFRMRRDFPPLDRPLFDAFREFAVPDISDQLNRLYALDASIHCLTDPGHRLCGPVCTVRVFPGDNLMVHKALDIAPPGYIIAIDARGSALNAVLGDLICTKARHRGIAGFVVDGLVRDLPGIQELDLPVFARGTTPVGPLHRGPGEINFPIACGGVVVNPGDLMVADACGIVVVQHEFAADVLARLSAHQASNADYLAAVQAGKFSNEWVDRLLIAHDCPTYSMTTPGGDAPELLADDEPAPASWRPALSTNP